LLSRYFAWFAGHPDRRQAGHRVVSQEWLTYKRALQLPGRTPPLRVRPAAPFDKLRAGLRRRPCKPARQALRPTQGGAFGERALPQAARLPGGAGWLNPPLLLVFLHSN